MPTSPNDHDRRTAAATGSESSAPRLAFIAVLALLAALTALALVLVVGDLTRQTSPGATGGRPAATAADPALQSVIPATPWLKPQPAAVLTRIGFGSCLDQAKPQPIWKTIAARKPELFLMVGDNVYAKDVTSTDARELIDAYAKQATQPELAAARATMPFLAMWDDHDYGVNDAGSEFKLKDRAGDIFRAFWQQPEARQADGGVYYSRIFGEPGRRVQVIMLDTRSFRSALKLRDASFPHWGKYQPDATPEKTVLGAQQWRWLAEELTKPAEIRIVVSSIQVLADGHGFERWGNLPAERKRLLDTIVATGAGGVVLLSGDRHSAARYEEAVTRRDGKPQLVVEQTSSSLNRPYGPSKDARLPPLVSDIYHPENFGMIDIDWSGRKLSLNLHAIDGGTVLARTIAFDDLGVKN